MFCGKLVPMYKVPQGIHILCYLSTPIDSKWIFLKMKVTDFWYLNMDVLTVDNMHTASYIGFVKVAGISY